MAWVISTKLLSDTVESGAKVYVLRFKIGPKRACKFGSAVEKIAFVMPLTVPGNGLLEQAVPCSRVAVIIIIQEQFGSQGVVVKIVSAHNVFDFEFRLLQRRGENRKQQRNDGDHH